jgi:hypothetical protein
MLFINVTNSLGYRKIGDIIVVKSCLKGLQEAYKTFQCYLAEGKACKRKNMGEAV